MQITAHSCIITGEVYFLSDVGKITLKTLNLQKNGVGSGNINTKTNLQQSPEAI